MDQITTDRPAAAQPAPRPAVIAIRKSCDAEGTGLSHFVLMDKVLTDKDSTK
ncbi:MAG: modified peptide precursor CbpA [Microcoleus sp. SM1_3_4]|nr:modified peptide precursor CbpA [Microcoleus sp. SM1_3_4]